MAKVTTTEDVKASKKEKEVPEVKVEEVKEEAKEVAPKADEKVTIHLIPAEWDNEEFYVFGINGTLTQINTGVDVEVSRDLAERIANVKRDRLEARKRSANGNKK